MNDNTRVLDNKHFFLCKNLRDILNTITLPDNPTVVFDIDDTLININGECIDQIINFYNYVKSLGIIVIIITNRSGDTQTINFTIKQLNQSGITGHKSIYFRSINSINPYKYKKLARKNILDRGMNIIMSIGDMPWDIGEYGGIGIIVPTV